MAKKLIKAKSSPQHSAEATSYRKVIYLDRTKIVNLQVLKHSIAWPHSVYVMDDSFEIDGQLWSHPVNDEPCNVYAWAELHFRSLYACPLDVLQHAIRIWWSMYERITTFLITTKHYKSEHRRLIYNTTWAMLGYTEGQDETAVKLSRTILNDPRFKKCGLTERYPDLDVRHAPPKDISNAKAKPPQRRGIKAAKASTPPKPPSKRSTNKPTKGNNKAPSKRRTPRSH